MVTVEVIGHPEKYIAPTEREAIRAARSHWGAYGHGCARILVTKASGEYHGAWMRY